MLRRRKADPPHLRANLEAALRAGAACEVDLVFTADGHGVCLHDTSLDRETTGAGPVVRRTRAEVEALRQRGADGTPLDSAPLFLDEVVAAMRRQGAPGEFRSNLHRGGSAERAKLTPVERATATRAAAAMGLRVAGVDMLRSDRGPLVLEINSSPGLEGIERASKVDVAGRVIEYIEKAASQGTVGDGIRF